MNAIVEPRSHEDTKSLEPVLRFAEFAGTYRKHLFDDLFEFSTGKNIKQNEASPEFEIPCVRYGELYHMYGEVIFNTINFTNLNSSELKFSKGDEILLPSAGEDPFDIGSASALALKNIAIGRTINILSPQKEGVYSPFYMSYYINQKQRKKISRLAKGVSISNVYNSDLKKLSAVIPDIQEQQKIADFLSSVDKKIEQLTEKHRLLTEYKKGVMQQIFTQQIRFKDNQGNDYPEWEEKKLGDVFYGTKGQGLSKNVLAENGSSKCILYGELYTTYPEVITEVISKTNELVSVQSIQGDLLIPCSTTTTGIDLANVTVINESGVLLGGDITVLRFIKNGNATFFAYYLTHHKKHKLASYGQGSTIVHMYYSHFKNMIINYPSSTEEQQKIANFLTEIDQKIDQAWSAIEQTKAFKKGLLQKMFV